MERICTLGAKRDLLHQGEEGRETHFVSTVIERLHKWDKEREKDGETEMERRTVRSIGERIVLQVRSGELSPEASECAVRCYAVVCLP